MISKKLRLAIISLCFPAMAFAQAGVGTVAKALPVDIDLGIKLGANFSKLEGSIFDDQYRTGFLAGAFGGVKFRKFGVTAELLYSRAKFTYKPGSLSGSLFKTPSDSLKPNTFAISTLSIPLLLNVKLVGPIWFQVGPQYTNLISIGDDNGFLRDVNDVFKNGDISGVVGLQANVSKINVGARYIFGLSNMNGTTGTSVTDQWKNRTIQLHIGYSFL
jgi:hypothetical protein